jgi:hypothetical protein
MTITAAPIITPYQRWGDFPYPAGSHISVATSAPPKIARPPSRGVAFSESPRARGSSIAPTARANFIVTGVSTAVTASATRNANTASSSVGWTISLGKASQARGSGV